MNYIRKFSGLLPISVGPELMHCYYRDFSRLGENLPHPKHGSLGGYTPRLQFCLQFVLVALKHHTQVEGEAARCVELAVLVRPEYAEIGRALQ